MNITRKIEAEVAKATSSVVADVEAVSSALTEKLQSLETRLENL